MRGQVDIADGRVRKVRGQVPQAVLDELADEARRSPKVRATLTLSVEGGRFRLSTFVDSSDTLRSMFGAVFMGVGGVVALGCTMGQAITGVSTLAIGSFIAFAAIVVGGIAGIKTIERMA